MSDPDWRTRDFTPPRVDVPPVFATSREAVFRFLVGELAAACGTPAEYVEEIVRTLMRRETLGSTGIGGGIALPGARSAAIVRAGVVVGHLPAPMDWDAIDAEPVSEVCLVLSPRDRPADHLRTLTAVVQSYAARRGD